MSDKTGIEWTEATWNPVTGCTKVSQGCKHCYAERDWARLVHMPAYAGRNFTDVATHAERLGQPLRWSRPRLIFVNSMSDLFHDEVPFEFIAAVFGVMAAVPRHTFQILTKRPARMLEFFRWIDEHPERRDYDTRALQAKFPGAHWQPFFLAQCAADVMPDADQHKIDLQEKWPLRNVWLGVSVEDQAAANERVPLLLDAPAVVRWISAEPLLGPVSLIVPFDGAHVDASRGAMPGIPSLDWVVVGGESGPSARPMHPDWAFSLKEQCEAAGTPFLFKQWGEWVSAACRAFGTVSGEVKHIKSDGSFWVGDLPDDENADVLTVVRVGKRAAGRDLGGMHHDGYPEVAA